MSMFNAINSHYRGVVIRIKHSMYHFKQVSNEITIEKSTS